MLDVVLVCKKLIHILVDRHASANQGIISDNVSREHAQILADAPNVQVVDSLHPVHLEKVGHHRVQVNAFGGAFQQDVNRLTQNAPSVPQKKNTDQHADERV